MVRMFIELDKEKIEREGIYSYEKMQQYIDEEVLLMGGYKDTDDWYTNGTWEGFMALATSLGKSDWFLDNAKNFLWNNKDYEKNPGDVCINDLLEEIRKESNKNFEKILF